MHGRLDPWYRRINWPGAAALAGAAVSAFTVAALIVWAVRTLV